MKLLCGVMDPTMKDRISPTKLFKPIFHMKALPPSSMVTEYLPDPPPALVLGSKKYSLDPQSIAVPGFNSVGKTPPTELHLSKTKIP